MPKTKTRDLRFSLKIKAKPEQVYRALTSATELCRWWLRGAETDARSAGRFRMVWPRLHSKNGSRRTFPPHAAVGESEGHFVDLQPGRKVGWMWKLPRMKRIIPPLANFFIEPKGRGSDVTLVHAGYPGRPDSDKNYQGAAQGWEDCLSKLKLYLETGRTCKTQILTFADLKRLLKKPR